MAENGAKKPIDVIKRIRAKYDLMSKGQQRVAEFLLTHGLEAVYLPAARIAELVEVSHSTVVRTAQAIGFEGFPDLQAALQEQLLGRINSATVYQLGSKKLIRELAEQQEGTDSASVLQRVMLTDARNIESLIPQISVADFDHTVDLIHRAPKVYVIGLRSSASLAMSLGLGLRHIRPNCFILQPGFGDLVDQVAAISRGDLLISICFGRYMRDTLRCMEYARGAGAQVVTFTDTPLSPAARRADTVFVVRYGVWFYGASAALFSLLNAIIAAVLLKRGDDAQERLEQLDGIIDQFNIFEPYSENGDEPPTT
jgi:DNA-binding MurR/RpiR family transcriptional regulator